MSNYYRITAYNPSQDISIVVDSNGLYQELWRFSAALVEKGFRIVQVGDSQRFLDGDIPKAKEESKYLLRTYAKGKPHDTTKTIDGIEYKAILVDCLSYVPDRTQRI